MITIKINIRHKLFQNRGISTEISTARTLRNFTSKSSLE